MSDEIAKNLLLGNTCEKCAFYIDNACIKKNNNTNNTCEEFKTLFDFGISFDKIKYVVPNEKPLEEPDRNNIFYLNYEYSNEEKNK